jgi:hypothetical protein
MAGMITEDTAPAEQPGAEPAPESAREQEVRAVAQHRQHAFEIQGVDWNVSALCFRRSEIAKVFAKEFSRRELFARRIGMPLSPAEPKWAALYNANAGAETQTLGRVVVRVVES